MIGRSAWAALAALAFVLLGWGSPADTTAAARQTAPEILSAFLAKVSPSDLVPGAERFGPARASPTVAPAYRGNTLLGHVYLNSQYVDANGYSGKPIDILIGLDLKGTIVGTKLVAHSEPIVLIGIPEQKIVVYLRSFIGYNPLEASAGRRKPPQPDIVSGATVTVLVMGESVTRSALRVARALQLSAAPGASGAAGSGQSPVRALDPRAGAVTGWSALIEQGAVSHLRVTVGQVNKAFADSGNRIAAQRPEPGADGDIFIDLYVALVSQPAIGRSLLGEDEYKSVASMLAPGQQAILVAGDGVYSFKGSGYVRGGIFDRIQLIQGAETIRFHDREHRRIAALHAEGAPALKEIGVFAVARGVEFDPTAPWRLQLLVQRATGALDKAFVSFELPYRLPQRYTKAVAADAAEPPAQGARASAAETAEQSARGSSAETSAATAPDSPAVDAGVPLWQRIWFSKAAAIIALAILLAILTFIFFFQDLLVKREALFDRIRTVYLAVILVWLGWVAQAQLSVVNVLTFTTALREGFRWSSFLVDPLVFILWASVACALLFWGRGPFCGWLCPFGALQELSNRAARALKVPQIKIPWRVHERLWPVKYIVFLVLFGVSLGSLAYAEMLAEIEPFKTAIILHFMREWWFVAFALMLLLIGLFVERFFCRYLCPLGAALAIPGRMRMFDWLKRYRECGNPCTRCFKECPVEAIHPEGHINPNECISCLHCQVLYHHDHKCPVRIQRRLKRERRSATTPPQPLGTEVNPIPTPPSRTAGAA